MNVISEAAQRTGSARPVRVTRLARAGWWTFGTAVVIAGGLVYLALLPYLAYSSTTNLLVNVFILITMASMWNLLAGYAGLVSVGQQAFIGLGAYFVLILAQHGLNPFLALPVASAACGVVGIPVWWLVSRLRTAYFAIATWVVASVCYLLIIRFPSLGGGTGVELPGMNYSATLLVAYTYWVSLIVVVVVLAGVYLLLRSRLGLVLTAIRDDEVAAGSSGVRVSRAQQLVFVVAAIGCGAAGALLIISQLNVEPTAAFSVSWSAQMIFATIIGGIGTIEGPIVGAIVFFVLQQTLSSYGTWYFMILGVVAIIIAIWARRGLWGLVADRVSIRVFPVGYWLWSQDSPRRGWRPRLANRPDPTNSGLTEATGPPADPNPPAIADPPVK